MPIVFKNRQKPSRIPQACGIESMPKMGPEANKKEKEPENKQELLST